MSKSEQSKAKYQGIFIAAHVPMKEDYALDLAKIETCVEFLISGGLKTGNAVYAALGAAGEHMQLSTEERMAVTEAAVAAAAGRLPVFVGVSHQATQVAVELAKHAERVGADGLQVEAPWYFAGTADDNFEYFRAISESVGFGITAYNTPWTSGFDMDRHFLDRLAGLENVVGLKWDADNRSEFIYVLRNYHERFRIMSNYSGVFCASVFIMGARGYVSQGANFAPRTNLRVLNYLREKKYEEATRLYLRTDWEYYTALHEMQRQGFQGEGNFIKAGMAAVGIPCGPSRLPLRRPPASFEDHLRRVLVDVGELPSLNNS